MHGWDPLWVAQDDQGRSSGDALRLVYLVAILLFSFLYLLFKGLLGLMNFVPKICFRKLQHFR